MYLCANFIKIYLIYPKYIILLPTQKYIEYLID
nr:MAG TPA: hypothetical protein [Caudoviricetes sp.]